MALNERSVLITNILGHKPTASLFTGVLSDETKLIAAFNEGEVHEVAKGCPIFELGHRGFIVDCDIKSCEIRRSLGKIASCVCANATALEQFKRYASVK